MGNRYGRINQIPLYIHVLSFRVYTNHYCKLRQLTHNRSKENTVINIDRARGGHRELQYRRQLARSTIDPNHVDENDVTHYPVVFAQKRLYLNRLSRSTWIAFPTHVLSGRILHTQKVILVTHSFRQNT